MKNYKDMTDSEKVKFLEQKYSNLEKELKQSDNSKLSKLKDIRGENLVLDQSVLQIALETYINQDLSNADRLNYKNLIVNTSNLLSNDQEYYSNKWSEKQKIEEKKKEEKAI